MTSREQALRPRVRPRRRGMASQAPRREAERIARRSAVAFSRWLQRRGRARDEAASRLDLAPGTLRRWERAWRTTQLRPIARGRRPAGAERDLVRAVLAAFHLLGPGIGLPTLQTLFPDVARGLLQELVERYRAVCWSKRRPLVYALRWSGPGRVWAGDLADPPTAIDGVFPHFFATRDLASSQGLAALPVPDASDAPVAAALKALFVEHGAPLVFKSDSGSENLGADTQQVLERFGVLHLRSPAATPRFNGAIEAGIGALKVRAHYLAARDDRPGHWSCDDLEGARRLANETHRPWGKMQPTPDAAWRARTPISTEERRCFQLAVQARLADERQRRGLLPGLEPSPREQRTIERVAITRALLDLDYLHIRRRRLTLPISRWKWARIP